MVLDIDPKGGVESADNERRHDENARYGLVEPKAQEVKLEYLLDARR